MSQDALLVSQAFDIGSILRQYLILYMSFASNLDYILWLYFALLRYDYFHINFEAENSDYQFSVVGCQFMVNQFSVSQSKTGKLETGKLETEN